MDALDAKILLLIEEGHETRDEMARFFRALGCILIPVADADSATVVVGRLRPDVILWLSAPPDGPARSAVASWRARRPDAAIVAVVAHGDAVDGLRDSGADAVLDARVGLPHLVQVVLGLLGAREGGPRQG
jgi:DNA-binding response OmpR family regulator